jgi:hypothetical protein
VKRHRLFGFLSHGGCTSFATCPLQAVQTLTPEQTLRILGSSKSNGAISPNGVEAEPALTPINLANPEGSANVGFLPLVTVVDFHHARGPEVEKWFGVDEGIDPAIKYNWPLLPFMALSDGAHA